MNIYVGNLSFKVTEQELEELFGEFGTVSSVKIITDRETGRSRGFGFVEMSSNDEGQVALDELNGRELLGRFLKISKARPKQERERSGGGGGDRSRGGGGGHRERRY